MIYKMKKKSEINISIVILNFNSYEFTINCLKSIELSIDKYLEYEIIVVDNGSNINDFKLLLVLLNSRIFNEPKRLVENVSEIFSYFEYISLLNLSILISLHVLLSWSFSAEFNL